MEREQVIQGFLDLFDQPRYLEVGVEYGVTFHQLRAAHKVAVDPQLRFDVPTPRVTQHLEYYEVPSDDYFGSRPFRAPKFDVIYLDGLHTFEQILRDVLNAIECLQDRGVIIIDDVLPTSYTSSLPSTKDVQLIRSYRPSEAADESWMGDVYRVVFFVQTFMQSWHFATVQENHGQLVMWRGVRHSVPHPSKAFSESVITDYASIFRRMTEFKLTPYAQILEQYRIESSDRKKR